MKLSNNDNYSAFVTLYPLIFLRLISLHACGIKRYHKYTETVINSIQRTSISATSPWYNHTGWLGVKYQVMYDSTETCPFRRWPCGIPLQAVDHPVVGRFQWSARCRTCVTCPLECKARGWAPPWGWWDTPLVSCCPAWGRTPPASHPGPPGRSMGYIPLVMEWGYTGITVSVV